MQGVASSNPAVPTNEINGLQQRCCSPLTFQSPCPHGALKCFTLATDIQLYLCDPQNPWQRGTNENTNGQLRRYLPKGIDISSYSQAKLNAVARQLNYKGFPPSQALAGLDVSLSDASRRIKVRIGHWPPCRHASAQRTRVRTAKLQPVMLQRSMLRTLMEDARRGSIR